MRGLATAALAALAGLACAHAAPSVSPAPETPPALPAGDSPQPPSSLSPTASDEDPAGRDIARVVEQQASQVRACYIEGIGRNPRLAGHVVVAWTVALDGHVRDVKVLKRELDDDAVVACLVAAVATWQFPPQPEEADVAYPFVFASE